MKTPHYIFFTVPIVLHWNVYNENSAEEIVPNPNPNPNPNPEIVKLDDRKRSAP